MKPDRNPAVIPLVDAHGERAVYQSKILRFALVGALLGAVALGLAAWLVVNGTLPIAGLGQLGAAGLAVAVFTVAGTGVALGGLIGALCALYRLPRADRPVP